MENIENKVYPFIKWLGGKTLVADCISKHFPKKFYKYYEPFVGGCGFIFRLINLGIIKPDPEKVVLSDSNPDLINLYHIVKTDLEDLIKLLDEHKANNSPEYFYKVREIDRDPEKYNKLTKVEKAARFVYLNKVCYNGLMRYNSKGEYNTPYGFYKYPLIYNKELLENVREVFKQVTIECKDYRAALKNVKKGDLVYLDPPYFPTSKTSNFVKYTKDGFGEKDQKELFIEFKRLKDLKAHVVESNSSVDFVKNLYKGYSIEEISAPRPINRTVVTELIIY